MTISIDRAIAKCAEIDVALHAELHATIARAADMTAREARREIGHYQRPIGPYRGWKRLSPYTLHGWHSPWGTYYPGKIALGFSPPDNPLLRTGRLRASIGYAVGVRGPESFEAEVGSKGGIVAIVQELGTRDGRVPARSYLGRAAVRKLGNFAAECGAVLVAVFGVGRSGLTAPFARRVASAAAQAKVRFGS